MFQLRNWEDLIYHELQELFPVRILPKYSV